MNERAQKLTSGDFAAACVLLACAAGANAQEPGATLAEQIVIVDLTVEGCAHRMTINGRKFNRLQNLWRAQLRRDGAVAETAYKQQFDRDMREMLRVMASDPNGACTYLDFRADEVFGAERPFAIGAEQEIQ
jgi:hypothetical protein